MSPFALSPRRIARLRATLGIGLAACIQAAPVLAQSAGSPRETPADTTKPSPAPAPFFNSNDALIGAGFAVATVAFFPLDRHLAERLQNPNAQANRFAHHAATTFEWFGSSGAFIIGGSLYLAGWAAHKPDIRDLGWHGTEAVIFASVATTAIKTLTGRSRPFAVADTNPHNFKLGGGISEEDRRSFPSGHTTVAFAAASAVTAEARRHWPDQWWSTWVVGPVMYGGATMVGVARMYHNRHWASDVALGAAIGTFSGRKVVDYSHSHPHNFIDRAMLGVTAVPEPGGGARVGWSLTIP